MSFHNIFGPRNARQMETPTYHTCKSFKGSKGNQRKKEKERREAKEAKGVKQMEIIQFHDYLISTSG